MRMKIFSERTARPPLSTARAWTCLLLNVVICPGLGSLIARRWGGLPQLALALGGSAWLMVPLGRYFVELAGHPQYRPDWHPFLRETQGGLVFLLAGWVWSILTSLSVLWQARKARF